MKGLKISVAFLTIAVAGLVGYVVYKEGFVKEENTVNTLEYENKISTLEKENKQLQENLAQETKCDSSNLYEQYAGSYIYQGKSYSSSKDSCDDPTKPEDYTYLEVVLKDDGTFEYKDALSCGSASSGKGKYIISNNTITAYNDECIKAAEEYGELQNCVLVLTYKIENETLKHSQFSRTDMQELTMTKK